MKIRPCELFLSLALVASPAAVLANNNDDEATFSTLIKTPLVIEGLTHDNNGNLYAPGRNAGLGVACPVWRTPIVNPGLTVVGLIPAPSATAQCSPSGLAFDRSGRLYVSQGAEVYRFTPNATTPPLATVFASGVPGTNGLAFDEDGNLWTGDGTTGQGRVWRISPNGGVCEPAFTGCTEALRIQPMANDKLPGGVGRDVRSLPPGTIAITPTTRNASNTLGSQPLVANGLAFDSRGDLFVADTARGAIWRARIRNDGSVASRTGCDTTFTANTLCLENLYVSHPMLEGADGIALDVAGNIWVSANERNAIVFVDSVSRVIEVYRNAPDPLTQLRNRGNNLEFPASPALAGHKLCTSNSDNDRRDNSPASEGEINAAGPDRGKISCLDQRVNVRGVRLPVD